MSDTLILAIVASTSAILGSFVTGWFTYRAAVKQREAERFKRKLIQAYKDIAALHRLEERYTVALAKTSGERSAESWKREVRKALRDDGFASPSDDATAQRAEQRASELG